jgi:DNA-binding transcriptional LysR family regulator
VTDTSLPAATLSGSRIKLRQLALVDAVAATRNLRRAAQSLNLTQPAASRLLQELETMLRVQLFERSRRGMAPTRYGEAVLRHARRVLADLGALQSEIDGVRHGETGRLRIGVLGSTAAMLLPPAIARLKADHPRAIVEIHEAGHDALVAGLRSGALDLVIARTLSDTSDPDLAFQLLFEERFVVVSGTQRRPARRAVGLDQLVDEPWILPPRHVPARQRLDAAFLAAAGRTPTDIIECAVAALNQTLLQTRPMLALMPDRLAAEYARHRLVHRVPVTLPDIRGPVALVMLADRPPLPLVARFLDCLRAGVPPASGGG